MWPDSLVRELVEKRCIIHLGSGISSQSANENGDRLPSWHDLLDYLKEKTLTEANDIQLVNEFLEHKKFLDAGEVIRTKGSDAEYNAKIKEVFIESGFKPSVSHAVIVNIAPKIISTTNFDTLMESSLIDNSGNDSFTQFDHTRDGLLDAIRSPGTILVKMHGCAKHSSQTILSRSDYFKLRKKHRQFFELTSSLYKVNTVLFIGCGIEDPDINLLLENNNIETDSSNPSYALVGSRSYAYKIRESIRSQYNIQVISYEQESDNDHTKFSEKLCELADKVDEVRAKHGTVA